MRSFNPVVQALVRAMIRSRRQVTDWLEIAAQLVRDHDTRFSKPSYQPCEETPCSLGVPLWLNENIKHVTVRVDRPPEPVFSAVDWDDDLVEVPFVGGRGSVSFDAIRKMTPETIDPKADRFTAHDHATFSQQIFNIRCTQGKPMIGSYGV